MDEIFGLKKKKLFKNAPMQLNSFNQYSLGTNSSLNKYYSRNLYSIRVYSSIDNTYITVPISRDDFCISDLKEYLINQNYKRSAYQSFDSDTSTVDSSPIISMRSLDKKVTTNNFENIEIYSSSPEEASKINLINKDKTIESLIRSKPDIKFIYEYSNISNISNSNEMYIFIYLKPNHLNKAERCLINITNNEIQLTLIKEINKSNNDDKINFTIPIRDLFSISKYPQIRYGFLIKKKGKNNSILLSARNINQYSSLLEKFAIITKIINDQELIDDADLKLVVIETKCKDLNETRQIKSIYTFQDALNSQNGINLISHWLENIKKSTFLNHLDIPKFKYNIENRELLFEGTNETVYLDHLKDILFGDEIKYSKLRDNLRVIMANFDFSISFGDPFIEDLLYRYVLTLSTCTNF
ncbi:hypothetical protein cand_017290 [Cryptosporidium andersoni]|uniref:Uncharacterized protein n=1 Tax=Cryptosporidium andersoni TaxID=117008 RepID=A0A1J4MTF8_9CRYT|nr:hypothetical protein cand_017290 [Cryptosporidium andersoni]